MSSAPLAAAVPPVDGSPRPSRRTAAAAGGRRAHSGAAAVIGTFAPNARTRERSLGPAVRRGKLFSYYVTDLYAAACGLTLDNRGNSSPHAELNRYYGGGVRA